MSFSIQPTLQNEKVILYPLLKEDFEDLYAVCSDPDIWAEHPNKNRWKREAFQNFFEGAMQSGGAFKIVDKKTNEIIGSTRFYGHDAEDDSVLIGYTFFATSRWSKGFNVSVKSLMLDYIFQYVNKVIFHIGAGNVRSQNSIVKIGAVKVDELVVTYYGEAPKLNFVYEVMRKEWNDRNGNNS